MKGLLRAQVAAHPNWTNTQHRSVFADKLRKRYQDEELPSHSTMSRYLVALRLGQISRNPSSEKLRSLNQHLRRCLIVRSVLVHVLSDGNPLLDALGVIRNRKLSARHKEYLLKAYERYHQAGGSRLQFCGEEKLGLSIATFETWLSAYHSHGVFGLTNRKRRDRRTVQAMARSKQILEILHARPHAYNINRTSWTGNSLAKAYENEYGQQISGATARRAVKKAGYSLRRARVVLTSNDPEYREKVALLLKTLHFIGTDEELFFIDEMGPIRVKKYGGRSYTKNGTRNTIPQIQTTNKGAVILCAALSATTNQVTWLYNDSKNSSAMIDLIEILASQYSDKHKLYVTWDAASWHSSNELTTWLDENNRQIQHEGNSPVIELVPLPSNAQFLDVIESVFGSMKMAVIHNSDYSGPHEMKLAISLHFLERNQFFKENPRRAGKKIWDVDFFRDYDNLKSGNYRAW